MNIKELSKELLNCVDQLKDCKNNEQGRQRREHLKDKIAAIKHIMERKKRKVKIPEGYEVIETILSCEEDGNAYLTIPLKPIKKELPKTWEEYCESTPKGAPPWLCNWAAIPAKHKALGKLEILRDVYNDEWVPDYTNDTRKYCIEIVSERIETATLYTINRVLAFKTLELRDEFLRNFESLMIEAKPLL